MPRELIAVAPRTPIIREYDEAPVGPTQIRIRTEFVSPKHGTELVAYRDAPAAQRGYDRYLGAVMPRAGGANFPRALGNMAVGTVFEAGPDVTRFNVGNLVFGQFPIRETITVDQTEADLLPAGLSAEAVVCLDPLVMALPMRDTGPKLGDRVAVFGLGAIGLMAVQLAHLGGAETVIAVDPIEKRRELAKQFGAAHVNDPTADDGDSGLAIRRLTGQSEEIGPGTERRIVGGYRERRPELSNSGVDLAIESSGNTGALHQAIRSTRFGGTICLLSFYGGGAPDLMLGEEFHVNRLTLVSARAESLPMRDAPGWTLERIVQLGLSWLSSGRIKTEGIVTPIVSFEESAEAYRAIDEHPDASIKLGIRFR